MDRQATDSSPATTVTEEEPSSSHPPPTGPTNLVLRLQQPQPTTTSSAEPRVRWAADTVDNENLNRRKSKCCCIYTKKREWDNVEGAVEEEEEWDECETGHCRGHVERKKQQAPNGEGEGKPGDEPGPSNGDSH